MVFFANMPAQGARQRPGSAFCHATQTSCYGGACSRSWRCRRSSPSSWSRWRRAATDAVHQARTRVRRLRSVLSVYRRAFDRDETDRLRARLKTPGTCSATCATSRCGHGHRGHAGRRHAPSVIDAVTSIAEEARADHERALAATSHHPPRPGDTQAARRPAGVRGRTATAQRGGARHPRKIARKGLKKAAQRVRSDGRIARGTPRAPQERPPAPLRRRRGGRPLRSRAPCGSPPPPRRCRMRSATTGTSSSWRRTCATAPRRRPDASTAAAVERLAAECERRAEERLDGLDERLDAIKHAA